MINNKNIIELGNEFIPKWNKQDLMPVVTIDTLSQQVLMLAYVNQQAIDLTFQTQEAHYFSRSSQNIWHKGAISKQIQKIQKILIDCDQDTLIYEVEATNTNCHRGYKSCFYRDLRFNNGKFFLKNIL